MNGIECIEYVDALHHPRYHMHVLPGTSTPNERTLVCGYLGVSMNFCRFELDQVPRFAIPPKKGLVEPIRACLIVGGTPPL